MPRARCAVACAVVFASLAAPLHADSIWPALAVADSFWRFWWVCAAGMLIEAVVLAWCLKIDWVRATLMSLLANAISSTVGVVAMVYGMIGWHAIMDPLTGGTFAIVNRIATLVIMWLASVVIETLVCRLGWQHPMRRMFPVLMLGNALSYAVVAVDLFALGGWWRQH